MDLDRLSEFAAVARGGNIKAVAQELGVPPATLSARLRGFEKELGMELNGCCPARRKFWPACVSCAES